jgi:hypothetical protein
MSGVVIPLPGLAVHIWQGASGWFGVDTVRGKLDPDFPPEGAELFEDYADANARAEVLQDRTGLPILSHMRSF